MSNAENKAVIDIVRRFLEAVSRGDRPGILANHGEDLVMFDFPDIVTGLKAYDATWDFFFNSQIGPIIFDPEDLKATVGSDVAFVHCLVHCEGTTGGDFRFRLTVGLEKRGDAWVITHEHHSMPVRDEVLVMPEKHQALGLS